MGKRKGTQIFFGITVVAILTAVILLRPPTWLFPVLFFIIFLFYSNTLKERVPLYLSNRTTWAALSELMQAESKPTDNTGNTDKRPRFVDLGCGLGGAVAYLARENSNWDVVGVETAPGPYLISKIRVAFISNAHVRFQSLWNVNLKDFDMAYAFLSPAPMERLCAKVKSEMLPKSVFISNSFWAENEPFDQEITVNDNRESRLFFKRL